MSPVNVDYRAHAQAVRDLLAAALPSTPRRVFDADEVPGLDGNEGTLPLIYVIPHVTSTAPSFGDTRRSGGARGTGTWLISVQVFSRTADESRSTLRRIREALEDQWLTVGDASAYVMHNDITTIPARDAGRYFSYIEFIYTL